MRKKIDVEKWNRREHFAFFSGMDDPFYGLVTDVDCTQALKFAKDNSISFFALYLHKSLQAINRIYNFKLRVVDGEVYQYEVIHASATLGREDGTFGFSFISATDNFDQFQRALKSEIEEVARSQGLRQNEHARRLDVIHYSTIPWNKFTGLTHAKSFNTGDSIPKITFGRYFQDGDKMRLPLSIDVHHGLVDAIHIGQFLNAFQEELDKH